MSIDNHQMTRGKRDKNMSQPINSPFTGPFTGGGWLNEIATPLICLKVGPKYSLKQDNNKG